MYIYQIYIYHDVYHGVPVIYFVFVKCQPIFPDSPFGSWWFILAGDWFAEHVHPTPMTSGKSTDSAEREFSSSHDNSTRR